MRLRKYLEQEQSAQKPKRARSRAKSPAIVAHRSFVPMLTVWGAAMLGLVVVVLPPATILRASTAFGLGAMNGMAQYMLAGIAAVFGAGTAFVAASAIRNRLKGREPEVSVVSAVTSRRVRPINPAADLGSESLDAPIEDTPFGANSDAVEEGEFQELRAELTDESAQDGAANSSEKGSEKDTNPGPTLGELSRRGYDIEDPEDCYAAGDNVDEQGAAKPGFTRSQFKSALIETCEGASCEAAPTIAPTINAKPEPASERPSLLAKKPLGRPASASAWSLTQFAPQTKADPHTEAQADDPAEKPRALDLSEFAQLPGRNAVWVEEPAPSAHNPANEADAARPRPPRPRAVPAASALDKLRQTPPENLSLVEMVERFAGALHEHQQAENTRMPRTGPGRDAALAEALKALTLFTERGFDRQVPETGLAANGNTTEESQLGQTERELREALVKLQNLRGAA